MSLQAFGQEGSKKIAGMIIKPICPYVVKSVRIKFAFRRFVQRKRTCIL